MSLRRILIPVIIGSLIGLTLLLTPGRSKTVTISVEGQSFQVTTSARNVSDALQEAGFMLQQEDEVDPSPTTQLKDGMAISLTQAMQVSLLTDGENIQIRTTQRIPAIWLAQAGLSLNEADRILIHNQPHPPEQAVPFQQEITAQIRRAVSVTLQSGSETWVINTSAPTLGQGLWESGFSFSVSDLLIPASETPLNGALSARLVPGVVHTRILG